MTTREQAMTTDAGEGQAMAKTKAKTKAKYRDPSLYSG
jgi:hypothetical protein